MKKHFLYLVIILLITFNAFAQDEFISGPEPKIGVYNPYTNNYEPIGILAGNTVTLGCTVDSYSVEASWTPIGSPDEYRVEKMEYNAKAYLGKNQAPTVPVVGYFLNTLSDDEWSSDTSLASQGVDFDFCYFGQQKNDIVISSNGIVSFDTSYANQVSKWEIQTMGKIAPDANCGDNKDAILQIHDVNPKVAASGHRIDTYSFWDIIGNVGSRYFIMGFHRVPMFSCGNQYGYATHQMVFYETTNIIEFHIKDKPICDTWAGGFAAMGIQNSDQTIGYAASGRDNLDKYQILDLYDGFMDGNFNSAYPVHPSESYRYIPDGVLGVDPVFTWYTDYGAGIQAADPHNPNLQITAQDLIDAGITTITYTAEIVYTDYCDGSISTHTAPVTFELQDPFFMHIKEDDSTNHDIEFLYEERIDLCSGLGGVPHTLEALVFNTTATSTITYQWYIESFGNPQAPIAGETNATYDIPVTQPDGTYVYEVFVGHNPGNGGDTCPTGDRIEVIIADQEPVVVSYPAPKVFCASNDDLDTTPIAAVPAFGTFTIDNGGVWLNQVAGNPNESTDGIIDLSASMDATTGGNISGLGIFNITYTAGCAIPEQSNTDTITITEAPKIITPQTVILFNKCADDEVAQTVEFDIDAITLEILNGLTGLNLNWENNDATGPVIANPLTGMFTTTSITIKVTATDPTNPAACPTEVIFDLFVRNKPVAVEPIDFLIECKHPALVNGVARFDGTAIEALILTTTPPANYTVTYSGSGVDTTGATINIPTTLPASGNFDVPSMEVTAYVTDLDSNCDSDPVTFDLDARIKPIVTVPVDSTETPLILCETDIVNNTAPFDTTNWRNIIFSFDTVDNPDTPDFIIEYTYLNAAGTSVTTTNIPNPLVSISQTISITSRNLEPISGLSCSGTTGVFNLVVNPIPVEVPQTPIEICSGDTLNIILNDYTTTIGNTYSWSAATNTNVGGETDTTSTNATILDVLTNTTATNQTVVYTIIPTSATPASCPGAAIVINVLVKPEPIGIATTVPACSAVAFSFDLATVTSSTSTYTMAITANGNVTGEELATITGTTLSGNITNISGASEDIIYTVTPTGANLCNGQPFIITVNVGFAPNMNNETVTVCSDGILAIKLDDYTTDIDNTYIWTTVDSANATGGIDSVTPNGGIITDNLHNESLVADTVVYTVTPFSANNCEGASFTVTVTVNPEPVATNTNITAPVCSSIPLNLPLSAYVPAVVGTVNHFTWIATDNADPLVTGETTTLQTTDTIDDTLVNTTITGLIQNVVYEVTPFSADNCEGEKFYITVTIGSEPSIGDQELTICSDDDLNLNLNDYTTLIGTTYTWTAVDNPNITGQALVGNTNIIGDDINNVTTTNQDIIYTVIPTNGCEGSSFTVTITIQPEPIQIVLLPIYACSNVLKNIDLTLHTTLTNNIYSWYAIDIDNPNVVGEITAVTTGNTIPNNITNTSGIPQNITYMITPTSSDGCQGNEFALVIKIGQKPVEITPFPITPIFCSSDNTLRVDLSTYTTLINNTYTWIADDNLNTIGETLIQSADLFITDEIINVTEVDQTVTYTVIPTSANNCVGSPFTVTITIHPEPVGDVDIEEGECSDISFTLNLDDYTTLVDGTNTYTWTMTPNTNVSGGVTSGNGNTITHTLINTSGASQTVIYTVTPTSQENCQGKEFTIEVIVGVEPVGQDTPIVACSDVPLDLTLDDYTDIDNITYSWVATDNTDVTGETLVASNSDSITDTLTNISGVVQYVIYTVTPTSAEGCLGKDFIVTVEVRFEPVGTDTNEIVCNNVALALLLDDYTTLTGNTYTWQALDNPNVSGESTDEMSTDTITDEITNTTGEDQVVDYLVTPTSEATASYQGCEGDDFIVSVTVNPQPQFELKDQYFICPETQIVIVGEDSNPSPPTLTYQWFVATDMSTVISNNVTIDVTEDDIMANGGIYALTTTDSNGCEFTKLTSVSMAEQLAITNIYVDDFNRPNNSIELEITGGSGDFEFTITGILPNGDSFEHTQTSNVFTGILAGTYEIKVEDRTGCSITQYQTNVHVLDYPPFFTPNGDTQHDTWQIMGAHLIPNSKIYIFDRFGKILAQVDPKKVVGWDGLYHGKQVPASDYWFTAEYMDPNTNTPKTVRGNFSIVRR